MKHTRARVDACISEMRRDHEFHDLMCYGADVGEIIADYARRYNISTRNATRCARVAYILANQ